MSPDKCLDMTLTCLAWPVLAFPGLSWHPQLPPVAAMCPPTSRSAGHLTEAIITASPPPHLLLPPPILFPSSSPPTPCLLPNSSPPPFLILPSYSPPPPLLLPSYDLSPLSSPRFLFCLLLLLPTSSPLAYLIQPPPLLPSSSPLSHSLLLN